MEHKKIVYVWLTCPNCRKGLLRHEAQGKFNIEIKCNHCKGVYCFSSEDGKAFSIETVQEPRRSYEPREFKEDL